jgi:hypothetical protein
MPRSVSGVARIWKNGDERGGSVQVDLYQEPGSRVRAMPTRLTEVAVEFEDRTGIGVVDVGGASAAHHLRIRSR